MAAYGRKIADKIYDGLCVERTNILLLAAMPVRTNQLHAMPTVIFSWNPYPQS